MVHISHTFNIFFMIGKHEQLLNHMFLFGGSFANDGSPEVKIIASLSLLW